MQPIDPKGKKTQAPKAFRAEKSAEKARVLVADDHPIVCQGLADLINRQSDVESCGLAASIAEVQQMIPARNPDLVLLDLRLGAVDGLESIKALKAQFPNLRILVISQFDEGVYAERALRAGALGYVMKEQATEEVLRAIRTVLSGQVYVSPRISQMAVARILEQKPAVQIPDLRSLSDRELHVFKAIGTGKTNKQIAADLNLSVKTIETYREHIKYKLRLSGSAELVSAARRAATADGAAEAGISP
jgi:DNA-binding NarL/FixJ family response regulator